MEDLSRYARAFSESYPRYEDQRYLNIVEIVTRYDAAEAAAVAASAEFLRLLPVIQPIIAIKNYKSQVPFPENDLAEVVRCVIAIRRAEPGNLLNEPRDLIHKLLKFQGFQLPTASAVLHFSHPEHFPIVDRNVRAACKLLKERFPDGFKDIAVPVLPSVKTKPASKVNAYITFKDFIDRTRELQSHFEESDVFDQTPTYRQIDKALMVLGVPRLRAFAERAA
jgi:hypothetical protein